MPITFDRLTGMVSSSSTTVTVSAETAAIAHSTNSWLSSFPTTIRSLSVPSGIVSCQRIETSPPPPAVGQAIDRTRAAGSSIRPSGRTSIAGSLPSQIKSVAESVDPSTSVSTSLTGPPATTAGRRTVRTRSTGTVTASPAGLAANRTSVASMCSSRPTVTVPFPCSTSTIGFSASIANVTAGSPDGCSTAATSPAAASHKGKATAIRTWLGGRWNADAPRLEVGRAITPCSPRPKPVA